MKEYRRSNFFSARSSLRSRSSCWYMPWNLIRAWSSSLMAPVISFSRLCSIVPLKPSLCCLIFSMGDKLFPSAIYFLLINISQISSLFLQPAQIFLCLIFCFATIFFNNLQHSPFHIHAHWVFGAAYVHEGS